MLTPQKSSDSERRDEAMSRRMPYIVTALVGALVIAGTRAILVSTPASPTVDAAAHSTTVDPAIVALASPNTSPNFSALAASETAGETASTTAGIVAPVSHSPSSRSVSATNARGPRRRSAASQLPSAASWTFSPADLERTDDRDDVLPVDSSVGNASNALRSGASEAVEAPAANAPVVVNGVPSAGPIASGRPARTTDWRSLLALPGVTLAFEDITDASSGTSTMSAADAVRTHSSIELNVNFDSLIGWHGLSVYAQHKSKTGRNGSGEGAFTQNYSNIDADDFRALGEVFVEQRLFNDRIRMKVGRLDFNSEFAGTDNGGSFLNASMGFSPSIAAAPTFPLPTGGVNLFVVPNEQWSFAVGSFNGLDGAPAVEGRTSRFEIAQANRTWTIAGGEGRLGLGAFRHTGLFVASSASIDEMSEAEPSIAGTRGWYATLDQTLWQGAARKRGDNESAASLAAFVQAGHSDERVQGVHAHHGGGLTLTGASSRRAEDVIGVGVTNAAWTGGGEFISELFYSAPVLPHLSLVADWQRVRRRELSSSRWMGSVVTLRTVLSF